ncbi:TetR family transcriptional regulator [Deinococcus altitudinis]|uniref:TetR/AcrR family transcriptional regulator n=1 Tax=Deinococcus altitudinis TaxID=468914 RepID=UPI003891A1DC
MSDGPQEPQPSRGRRPGVNTTRQAVLNAARSQFAAHGFAATTIRSVALEAGVDASLVMQFFRSKPELFAAVMELPPSVLSRLDQAFQGAEEGRGANLVQTFLDLWEGAPSDSEPLMSMLRGAVVNDLACEHLRDFIEARLVEGLRSQTEAPTDSRLRAGVAASMLVGLVLSRCLLKVPTLAEAEREHLIRIVAPAIQAVISPSDGHTAEARVEGPVSKS